MIAIRLQLHLLQIVIVIFALVSLKSTKILSSLLIRPDKFKSCMSSSSYLSLWTWEPRGTCWSRL